MITTKTNEIKEIVNTKPQSEEFKSVNKDEMEIDLTSASAEDIDNEMHKLYIKLEAVDVEEYVNEEANPRPQISENVPFVAQEKEPVRTDIDLAIPKKVEFFTTGYVPQLSKKETSGIKVKNLVKSVNEAKFDDLEPYSIEDLAGLDTFQIQLVLNTIINKSNSLINDLKAYISDNDALEVRINKLTARNTILGKDKSILSNRLLVVNNLLEKTENSSDFAPRSGVIKSKAKVAKCITLPVNNQSSGEDLDSALKLFEIHLAKGKLDNMHAFSKQDLNYLYHLNILYAGERDPEDIAKPAFYLISKEAYVRLHSVRKPQSDVNHSDILLSGDVEVNPGPFRHIIDRDHPAQKKARGLRAHVVNHLIQEHGDETIPMLNKLYDEGKIAKDPSVGGIFNDIFHIIAQFGGRTMQGIIDTVPGIKKGIHDIMEGDFASGLSEIINEAKNIITDPSGHLASGVVNIAKALVTDDQALTDNISKIFPHSKEYNDFFGLRSSSNQFSDKAHATDERNRQQTDPDFTRRQQINFPVVKNDYSATSSSELARKGLVETNPGPISIEGTYSERTMKWSASELWGTMTEYVDGDKSDFTRASDGIQLFSEINTAPVLQTNLAMLMKGVWSTGPLQGNMWVHNAGEKSYVVNTYVTAAGIRDIISPLINSIQYGSFSHAIKYGMADLGGKGLSPTGLGERFLSEQSFYNLTTQSAAQGTQIDGLTRGDMVKMMTRTPVRGANLSTYLVKLLYLYTQYVPGGAQSLTSNLYDNLIFDQVVLDQDTTPGGIVNDLNLQGRPGTVGSMFAGLLEPLGGFGPTYDPYSLYINDTVFETGLGTTLAFYTTFAAIPPQYQSRPTILLPYSMMRYLPIWIHLQTPMPLTGTYDTINLKNRANATTVLTPCLRAINKTIIDGNTTLNIVITGTSIPATTQFPIVLNELTFGRSQADLIADRLPIMINTSDIMTATYSLKTYLATWFCENPDFASTSDWTSDILGFMNSFLFPRLRLADDLDYAYSLNVCMAFLYEKVYNPANEVAAAKSEQLGYRPINVAALAVTSAPAIVNALGLTLVNITQPNQCVLPEPDCWAANLLIAGLATQGKSQLTKEFDILRYPTNSICLARTIATVTNCFIQGSCISLLAWNNFLTGFVEDQQVNYYNTCAAFDFNTSTRRWMMERFYNTYFLKVTGWTVPRDSCSFSIVSGLQKPVSVLNPQSSAAATDMAGLFLTATQMASVARSLPFEFQHPSRLERLPAEDDMSSKARLMTAGAIAYTAIPSNANFTDVKSSWQITKSMSSIRSIGLLGSFTIPGNTTTNLPISIGAFSNAIVQGVYPIVRQMTQSQYFIPVIANIAPNYTVANVLPWIKLFDIRRKEALIYVYANVASPIQAAAITDAVKGNYINNISFTYTSYDNPRIPKISFFEAQDSGMPNIAAMISKHVNETLMGEETTSSLKAVGDAKSLIDLKQGAGTMNDPSTFTLKE